MGVRIFGTVRLALALLCTLVLLPDTVSVWMDPRGHTYLGEAEEPPVPGAVRLDPEELSLGWKGRVTGAPLEGRTGSSPEEDRFTRALIGARDDVLRGEVKRGLAGLRRLHRSQPARLEAAVLLAQVEQRRGRLLPAREALETALSMARLTSEPWHSTALKLRREIDEEIEFAESEGTHGATRSLDAAHFHLVYDDHDFAGREYGERVLELLEQARLRSEKSMGRTLGRPLEVQLYTRARYLEAYEHRFGFATVGFYDGAIHVVTARHPRRELFPLVVHEYVHALFADALGGHEPFFLNEGIADGEEERARGRPRLSRGEWRQLLEALRADDWIPLSSLVEGFGRVKGKRALLAYLESRAAVEMIESHSPGAIGRWLERCADGAVWEDALEAETGWDTAALESALKERIRSRFIDTSLVGIRLERSGE